MNGGAEQFHVTALPNALARKRYSRLVGLDDIKARLDKEARILIDPSHLHTWNKNYHSGELVSLIELFSERPPLFVFVGDVGTGKSVLAETFGDRVAREEKIDVTLYRMSLNTRGSGAVGEMTRLLSDAFAEVIARGKELKQAKGRPSSAVILLIDEADAIAQSRELAQMHHEDRAGVNTLIRGLDDLGNAHLPVIVVMCSNRAAALDPAVKRRAASIFEFKRPDVVQRIALLESAFAQAGFSSSDIQKLAEATGEFPDRTYGFTYSDLSQKLLPAILLDAFPSKPITFSRALEISKQTKPTPPFSSEGS